MSAAWTPSRKAALEAVTVEQSKEELEVLFLRRTGLLVVLLAAGRLARVGRAGRLLRLPLVGHRVNQGGRRLLAGAARIRSSAHGRAPGWRRRSGSRLGSG